MGLFDKIKKAAPAAGATAAAAGAAAAGVYGGQAFAKDKPSADETPERETDKAAPQANPTSPGTNSGAPEARVSAATAATPPENVDRSAASQTQVNTSPESIYDSETDATTYNYANGNTLIEYADGSRAFYDASTGETTGYDASTGKTITYESDGDVRIDNADGSRVTVEADGDITGQTLDGTAVKVIYDPTTGNTVVEGYDGINTGVFNSNGELISTTYAGSSSVSEETAEGLFDRIKQANADIPDEMKAAGLGIPDKPVQEFRTYQEGSLEDGQVRTGYEFRTGWESTYNTHHTGQDEVAPGVGWNSEATYDAQSFMGVSSRGEAGGEWNSEKAHLYAEGRTMVGAEANVNATYQGTLDVEGVKYQPGAEVQGHANAFAGAEAEGRGDLNVSSEGARGNLGGEVFAGAKAEAGGSGSVSINGNDFARGEGGADIRGGIGVEFDVDAGYQDGQISGGIDLGGALGVGFGYQYSGSVDAPGIITHPDAVWDSAVEEVTSYVPEMPDFSTDPNTYTAQAEQYVVQQVQEYVPVLEEVSQVAEVINDPVGTLEDIGGSLFG